MYHNTLPCGWHPLAYCVPPYFGLAYCVPFINKTTIFGNFIYIKKIKWQYVACTCTIILANIKFGLFGCKISYSLSPNQFFMLINAGMTPTPLQRRERSERAKILELFDFVCHVCCCSWWKLFNNHLNL